MLVSVLGEHFSSHIGHVVGLIDYFGSMDQRSATNIDDLAYLAYLSFPGFSVSLAALFSANMAWAWLCP
jgi:hypothetical protein